MMMRMLGDEGLGRMETEKEEVEEEEKEDYKGRTDSNGPTGLNEAVQWKVPLHPHFPLAEAGLQITALCCLHALQFNQAPRYCTDSFSCLFLVLFASSDAMFST